MTQGPLRGGVRFRGGIRIEAQRLSEGLGGNRGVSRIACQVLVAIIFDFSFIVFVFGRFQVGEKSSLWGRFSNACSKTGNPSNMTGVAI